MGEKIASVQGAINKNIERLYIANDQGEIDKEIQSAYIANDQGDIDKQYYANWQLIDGVTMMSSSGFRELTQWESYTLNPSTGAQIMPTKVEVFARFVKGYGTGSSELRLKLEYQKADGTWVDAGYEDKTSATYYVSWTKIFTLSGTVEVKALKATIQCRGDSLAWIDISSSSVKCVQWYGKP